MVATAVIWLAVLLGVRGAPEPCAGRGSVRGHAEHQPSCAVAGRLYRHTPPALLARWRQFVSVHTVQEMRGQVHHLARRKRSAAAQQQQQEEEDGQPCCQSRYSVLLPLSAVSSATGRRVQLAQAPPHHVQPVLVVSCDEDRCPKTNATCDQEYAPQMLLRVSGRRLQFELVDVESGCRCAPSNTTTVTAAPAEPPSGTTELPPPGPRIPGADHPQTDSTTAREPTATETSTGAATAAGSAGTESQAATGRTVTTTGAATATTGAATATTGAATTTTGVATATTGAATATTGAATATTRVATMTTGATAVTTGATTATNGATAATTRAATATTEAATPTTGAATATTGAATMTTGATEAATATTGAATATTGAATATTEAATATTGAATATTGAATATAVVATATTETTTMTPEGATTTTKATTMTTGTTMTTEEATTTTKAATMTTEEATTTTKAAAMTTEEATMTNEERMTTEATTMTTEAETATSRAATVPTGAVTITTGEAPAATEAETATTEETKMTSEEVTMTTEKAPATSKVATMTTRAGAATTEEATPLARTEVPGKPGRPPSDSSRTESTAADAPVTALTAANTTPTVDTTIPDTTTVVTETMDTITTATAKASDTTTVNTTTADASTTGTTTIITTMADTTMADTTMADTTMTHTTVAATTINPVTAATTGTTVMTGTNTTTDTTMTTGTTTMTDTTMTTSTTMTDTTMTTSTTTMTDTTMSRGTTTTTDTTMTRDSTTTTDTIVTSDTTTTADTTMTTGTTSKLVTTTPTAATKAATTGAMETERLPSTVAAAAPRTPLTPTPTPTPTPSGPVTVTRVSTVCHGTLSPAVDPPEALALLAAERAGSQDVPAGSDRETEDGGAGRSHRSATATRPAPTATTDTGATAERGGGPRDAPLRGDMAPRADTAADVPRPRPPAPADRAPLVSTGQHQTHNLSQALLHLAGLVGALPQWPPQPHQLTEDHIRLAGLLAAAYNLGKGSCKRNTTLSMKTPSGAVLPAWVPVPAPQLPAGAVAVTVPSDGEREEKKLAALVSGRSRRPDSVRHRSAGLVLGPTAELGDDWPPEDAASAVPAGRLAAMRVVEQIMERHRSTLRALYSRQRQQLDEQMQQQRRAIQHTFNVELQYVANILTATDSARPEEASSPYGEDDKADGGGVGTDEEEEDDSGERKKAEDGDDSDSSEADFDDTVTVTAATAATAAVGSEEVDLGAATGAAPVTAAPGSGMASTPFGRSPRTTAAPECSPFEEDAAREALIRDTRVLMDSLFDVALELFQAVRPDEVPAGRSAPLRPRVAAARSPTDQLMGRLVRAVAGSSVRFQFSLAELEERGAALERLQQLLRAGADRPQDPGPGSTDYNLTTAVTALTSCFIDGMPGFRMERQLDGETTFALLRQEPAKLRDQGRSSSSMALRLAAGMEHVWNLYRFLFNSFVRLASTVELRTDQNLRVVSLRPSELHAHLLRAISGLGSSERAELQRLLAAMAADSGELRYAVSELRQLMTLFSNISALLLTARPDGGQQTVEAGPAAVIRSTGDSLLGSLDCLLRAVAGTWSPAPSWESAAPSTPAPAYQPGCQSLEETAAAILDSMPIFAEMLYKIGLKFTDAFKVEPNSRQTAGAVLRLDTAGTPSSRQLERLVTVVAGSTARFRVSLTTASEYISQLERLRTLLTDGAGRPPQAAVRLDHNLTAAVSLMTTCFVEHVPGFELQDSAGAKSVLSAVTEMEAVHIEKQNTGQSVAMRLSVVMVGIWTNWIAMFNTFVRPTTDVQLQPSTNVRLLSLRQPALRGALLSAISSLSPQELAELRQLCAQLTTGDRQLQPVVFELRHLMDYLADITDLLLTTGAVGRQAIAAGPSAVIRHMGYALLHSLGCFSAALAGSETTDAWGTPSPPTAPPPSAERPAAAAEPAGESPQCQLLQEANSDDIILGDLEVLMKDLFDMGLTFFGLFQPDPVFGSSSLPESRSAVGPAPVSEQMTWLVSAVRRSAGRYQFPLRVLQHYGDKLDRLWTLMAVGAGNSPLGRAESDHNLTEAVSALAGCFVEHVPGYHLEQTMEEAKATEPGVPEFLQQAPHTRRTSESDSVTLRVADIVANIWRVWRYVLSIFVRPAATIRLHPEKNIRVLSLSRPRLHSSLVAAFSALDVVQRAELRRLCDELASAELRFSVSELQHLMAPLAELSRLRLTKAPQARQQAAAAAGPAAIVVRVSRALPHSLSCFLAALAGTGADESPGQTPEATEIPATVRPGAVPIPGIPLSGAGQPTVDPETDATTATAAAATTTAPPPPPPQDTTVAAEDGAAETHTDDPAEHEDPFLTEQEIDVVDDILAGLG